ncbi:unnamed protein product [Calypogeia fissa]
MGRLKASVPSNVAELLVVRHGETNWNVSGRLQGQAESDLTDNGVKQAHAVADRLGRGAKDVVAVYSSDLKRAVETAQLIADKCGRHEVIRMDSLRERHLGNLQGYTRAEAMTMEPEALQASTSDDHDEAIPGGGESLNQLYARTKTAMEEIAQRHQSERVVVVSHGGVLRALYMHAEGRLPSGRVQNTSLNVFHISGSREWTIRSWGDVNHLQAGGFLRSVAGGDELA